MNTRIQESVQACNAQLYGCEIIPGPKNNTLRIYIDNPDGVTDQLLSKRWPTSYNNVSGTVSVIAKFYFRNFFPQD